MSNETHEPHVGRLTDGGLTDAEVEQLNVGLEAGQIDFGRSTVCRLLNDRAALVAEVARLQHAYDMNETTMNMQDRALKVQHADLASTRAQNAEMRPLVEALANDDASVYVNGKTYCGTCHVETWPDEKPHVPGCKVAQAIVMVATWQKGGVDSEA